MRQLITFSALVASCVGFGFINSSSHDVFVGEPSTVSWDQETVLPVSLTLLPNANAGGWAVAAGIYNTEFIWTPWDTGNLNDDYVMLLVDGNGNSSFSPPFLIQDPNLEPTPLTNNETNTSSTNTTSSSSELIEIEARSAIASSFEEFSPPAAASTVSPSIPAAASAYNVVSAASAVPTVSVITASYVEVASTTIVASFAAAASTFEPSSPAIVFSTETLSAPAAQSTDSEFGGENATEAGTGLEETSKRVTRLTKAPQNSTSTSNLTTHNTLRTNNATQVRLAVSITIVVLLVFIFSILIAFEYGKRLAVRGLNSDCGESFRGEVELLRMNSSKGLRLLTLSRTNSDKGWEANEMRKDGVQPVSAVEQSDAQGGRGGFGRKSMKSIYEMA